MPNHAVWSAFLLSVCSLCLYLYCLLQTHFRTQPDSTVNGICSLTEGLCCSGRSRLTEVPIRCHRRPATEGIPPAFLWPREGRRSGAVTRNLRRRLKLLEERSPVVVEPPSRRYPIYLADWHEREINPHPRPERHANLDGFPGSEQSADLNKTRDARGVNRWTRSRTAALLVAAGLLSAGSVPPLECQLAGFSRACAGVSLVVRASTILPASRPARTRQVAVSNLSPWKRCIPCSNKGVLMITMRLNHPESSER